MAVNLDNAPVDHRVLEVGAFGQGPDHSIEGVRLHPSAEPFEDGVPLAEFLRPITPRTPGARNPQHRFNTTPRIRASAARVTGPAKAGRRDERPLRVGQYRADQARLPLGHLESLTSQPGNPQTLRSPSFTQRLGAFVPYAGWRSQRFCGGRRVSPRTRSPSPQAGRGDRLARRVA